MTNYKNLCLATAELARETGLFIRTERENAGIEVESKGKNDFVTQFDKEAERRLVAGLEKLLPESGFIAEESTSTKKGQRFNWIIDPIDGTKSFVHGVPLYGVLIGLEIEGTPAVGTAYFPALDEMLSAATGLGAWWNGRRCRVSEVDQLDRAVIAHADTHSFGKVSPAKGAAWDRLAAASYYNAGWCDAYGYALVATGRCEAMLDPVMNLWDCAALLPIVKEAGGYFGDWKGHQTIDAGEALATNAALQEQILAMLEASH